MNTDKLDAIAHSTTCRPARPAARTLLTALLFAAATWLGAGGQAAAFVGSDPALSSGSDDEVAPVRLAQQIPPPDTVAAPPFEAERTESGLAWVVLQAGLGTEHPGPRDEVTVHYTGWTTDGAMFDSSVVRGEPATFPLDRVIAGWTEGLQLMVPGEKRLYWIPEALAYEGRPGRPAGMLVFEVELLGFVRSPEPPPAPEDVASPPPDAQRSQSGLAWRVLQEGTGTENPGPQDVVTAHYSGWTTDGNLFDSSVVRGEPAAFPLDRVIAGWTEGLQLMVEGEKRLFWIPEALAYQGRPGRPAGMLVFEVELLSFERTPEPPPVPENVAAPPAEATQTESGLASLVLQEGTGTRHPLATDQVEVHYTGWTTDGNMFDSSVVRGQTAAFRLNEVIAGWTEGVQLMVEGEKRRFWIPEALAYQGRPGRPAGMLVFDVELVRIAE